jgi:hypothetical protein
MSQVMSTKYTTYMITSFALKLCYLSLRLQAEAMGFSMRLLDLGGGFTGRFDSEGNILSMKVCTDTTLNYCFK